VVAVIWLAPGGLADRLLGGLPVSLIRDRAGIGIVLVYVYKEAPFLALLVLATMGRSLAEREEAAAVCGADWLRRVRFVVWPTIRRPLATGCLIVGAFAFGAFEVPLVVGPTYPPTVATYALQATQGDLIHGQSLAAAALLVAAAASFLLAAAAVGLGRGTGD
jgi:putative spermidine/putrescine transport system permease protein